MIVSFQAIDWVAKDVGPLYDANEFKRNEVAYGEPHHDPCENLEIPKYNIKVFGRALNKDAISVNARDYTPHFYIKLPKELNNRQIDAFKDYINSQIPEKWLIDKDNDLYYYTKKSLHDVVATSRKDLWGFTNNKLFPFLRISFHNDLIMKYVARLFKKAVAIVGVFKKTTFALYESNIEPYLRFIHKQNIQPAGWIEIDKNTCEINTKILPSKKGILDYNTNWKNVIGVDKNIIAPFIVASFDIECNSSHGDFPVPQKDYEKIAIELNTIYHKIVSTNEKTIKDILITSLLSGFDNTLETEYKISKIYTKKPYDIDKLKLYLNNGLIDDIYVILKGKLQFQKDDKTKVEFNNYLRKSSICDNDNEELTEMEKFKNIFKQTKDVENTISKIIKQLTDKLTAIFPDIEGDQVIQIGTTFHVYGEKECFYKNVITLDTCDEIAGVEVVSVDNEKDLIKAWIKVINKYDPDIITGYNILGFDFNFLYKRCLELRLKKQILKINRIKNYLSEWKVHTLSSSALGDNELKYVNPEGRVLIDIMKVVQRDHKLDSYKLDYVSGNFISGKIKLIEIIDDTICCTLDSTNGIQIGSYVVIGENEKTEVKDVKEKNIYIEKKDNFDLTATKWGLSKDDVTPKEIFECQKGTSSDRARVAKYCVMDCALCNYLMIKLETLANNIGMSNVCSIPLSYIFMRGQGIKIFSFVAKQCKEDDFLIPTLDKDWKCDFCSYKNSSYNDTCYKCTSTKPEDEGYEGAIVLHPKPGIYTDDPIAVLDYASLYPSSMISENISHDSIVLDSKYDNLPGFEYVDITYDIFEGKGDKKKKIGEETCRYAQFKDNKKGVLPRILQKLLTQRKDTRKKIEEKRITLKDNSIIQGIIIENSGDTLTIIKNSDKSKIVINIEYIVSKEDVYNEFEKAVLDGLQLAYKVTANSLYGQVGAKTSAIFLKELAASTTATGRNLILGAKKFVEDNFPIADVIYGDTDSIFISFKVKERFNLSGKEAIKKAIELGKEASDGYQKHLKKPHVLEYEKTFYPFIIFSKKRYVGNLYEHDENKYKRKVMGLSLVRRDFANIQKIVYGGIIDIILKTNDIQKSLEYFHKCINDILEGKYPLEEFVITKTLKGQYKTPDRIVHKVLADRMAMRDKGSAPQVNDRVPFVYITKEKKKGQNMLQGERVEDPLYIRNNKLPIDYEFYITNQIQNSVTQLYSLIIEDLPEFKLEPDQFIRMENTLKLDKKNDEKKIELKIKKAKEKIVENILFTPYINKLFPKKNNMRDITDFLILHK